MKGRRTSQTDGMLFQLGLIVSINPVFQLEVVDPVVMSSRFINRHDNLLNSHPSDTGRMFSRHRFHEKRPQAGLLAVLRSLHKHSAPLVVKEHETALLFEREQHLSEKLVVVGKRADGPGCKDSFHETELVHYLPVFSPNVMKVAAIKPIREGIPPITVTS